MFGSYSITNALLTKGFSYSHESTLQKTEFITIFFIFIGDEFKIDCHFATIMLCIIT
jgi:hypothetical protein